MEHWGEAIKVFAEKHLMPSVISLVAGAFVFIFTPDGWWIITKIGTTNYWLLATGCIFLIIQFLLYAKNRIKDHLWSSHLLNVAKDREKYRPDEEKQAIWDIVDSLTPEDREYLYEFLKNGNTPIIIQSGMLKKNSKLFQKQYTHSQSGRDENGIYTKYILTDLFYKMLVDCRTSCGKISRFEEV